MPRQQRFKNAKLNGLLEHCLQGTLLEIVEWFANGILIYDTKQRFMLSQNRSIIASLHIYINILNHLYIFFIKWHLLVFPEST